MKISTKGRYALRIMIDLANQDPEVYTPLKEISSRQGISIKYLEQIVPLLTRAGYLKSLRGNSGGYRLAKLPAEYKVGDILRTTEGDLAPIACLEGEKNDCPRKDACTTLSFWEGLKTVINDYVDIKTLADFL